MRKSNLLVRRIRCVFGVVVGAGGGGGAAIAVVVTIYVERVDIRVRSMTTNQPKHQKSIFLLNSFRNSG